MDGSSPRPVIEPTDHRPPVLESLALDRWLRDQLRQLHGAVLHEPLPPCLRAVLEERSG
jgi:hypothetical protein